LFFFLLHTATSLFEVKASTLKKKRGGRFETCSRILALLVGKNVTTQAPFDNNNNNNNNTSNINNTSNNNSIIQKQKQFDAFNMK
jgi:hypothetical protein